MENGKEKENEKTRPVKVLERSQKGKRGVSLASPVHLASVGGCPFGRLWPTYVGNRSGPFFRAEVALLNG